jgi:hypothetical protein
MSSHLIWSLELQKGRGGWGYAGGIPTILTTTLVAVSMPLAACHKACWWMTIWAYRSQSGYTAKSCQRMIYVLLVVQPPPPRYYYYYSILYISSQIMKSVHYSWLTLHIASILNSLSFLYFYNSSPPCHWIKRSLIEMWDANSATLPGQSAQRWRWSLPYAPTADLVPTNIVFSEEWRILGCYAVWLS